MRTTITVIGKVKENKNKTLYIDAAEGRVFLGKTSGFTVGQNISGDAVCDPIDVTYPATAAVGTLGQPGYRPAQEARTEKAWQVQNFMDDDALTQQIVNKTRKAQANFALAVVTAKTGAVASIAPADLFNLAV